MALEITNIQSFPNGLAITWNDEKDSFVDYKTLREQCPCANCSGESEVFGNLYKGPEIKLTENAYKLINVIQVGNYAIRITWGDGHSTGLFSYDYLRKLDIVKEDLSD